MNRIKKCNYNRIKHGSTQSSFNQCDQRDQRDHQDQRSPRSHQEGEGVFDIFKSTGQKIGSIASSKFSKEVAKKAATAGLEKFAVSGAEALGKSAADKIVGKISGTPSIIKENKPVPNSGIKIADSLKKVDSLPPTVQASEIDVLKHQLAQFM